MTDDDYIKIELDNHAAPFWPGDQVHGRYRVAAHPERELRAAECSILWHTVGKGDEDLGVHYFHRVAGDLAQPLQLPDPVEFTCDLPAGPLSYDGVIVKIVWCVRVRLFFARANTISRDQRFRVGEVASGRVIASPHDLTPVP